MQWMQKVWNFGVRLGSTTNFKWLMRQMTLVLVNVLQGNGNATLIPWRIDTTAEKCFYCVSVPALSTWTLFQSLYTRIRFVHLLNACIFSIKGMHKIFQVLCSLPGTTNTMGRIFWDIVYFVSNMIIVTSSSFRVSSLGSISSIYPKEEGSCPGSCVRLSSGFCQESCCKMQLPDHQRVLSLT